MSEEKLIPSLNSLIVKNSEHFGQLAKKMYEKHKNDCCTKHYYNFFRSDCAMCKFCLFQWYGDLGTLNVECIKTGRNLTNEMRTDEDRNIYFENVLEKTNIFCERLEKNEIE